MQRAWLRTLPWRASVARWRLRWRRMGNPRAKRIIDKIHKFVSWQDCPILCHLKHALIHESIPKSLKLNRESVAGSFNPNIQKSIPLKYSELESNQLNWEHSVKHSSRIRNWIENLFLLQIDHIFPADQATILFIPASGYIIAQCIQEQFCRSVGVNHQRLCTEECIMDSSFLA